MNNFENILKNIYLNSTDNHICNYILCEKFEPEHSKLELIFELLKRNYPANEAFDMIICALYIINYQIHQRYCECPETIYEKYKTKLTNEKVFYVRVYKNLPDEILITFLQRIFNISKVSITCEEYFEICSKATIDYDNKLLDSVNTFYEEIFGDKFQNSLELDGKPQNKRPRNSISKNNNNQQDENESIFYYAIKDKRDNLCLIFNASFNRRGSEQDVIEIKSTFENINGFKVLSNEITTREKLLNDIKDSLKLVTEDSDLIVTFIMSHGEQGIVFDCFDESVIINDILELYSSKMVPQLSFKPKIFVFQTCRGNKKQEVIHFNSPNVENIASDAPRKVSNDDIINGSDIFIVYSTIPGHSSMRDKYKGAYFIRKFCEVIKENSKKRNLDEICTLVNTSYEKYAFGEQEITQLCEVRKVVMKFNIYLEKPDKLKMFLL
uniref:Caspase-6 n=1 Tax=Dugesia japonica TaxID=6161 RepID=A0A4Y6I0V5_DUGJA|nr:caspase-6 [Dugesia japonica]